jgi:adenosylcobinamide-GDP ribazoletransferase
MRTGWCFPIVGVGIGCLAGVALWLGDTLGLPVVACALIAIIASALLTGALHEDGLADLADGFGGGRDKPAKITIMRDSRIGSYGVLALILATGLKTSALVAILLSDGIANTVLALVLAHAAARGMIVPVTFWLPTASESGLGRMAGKPKASTVQIAMAIAAGLLFITLPPGTALATSVTACIAAAAIAALARRQIGGYTGDVLGAVEQVSETAILLCLAAAVAS